jgi:ATP-dependent Clp protease adaptor protein ClpS
MNTQFTYNTEEQIETDVLDMLGEQFNLIVWNDDINTFDWVIKTLIDVCGHEYEQAEQCAMFIHFKGKYAVKSGDFDILKPMCDAITDRGIGATVEEMAA